MKSKALRQKNGFEERSALGGGGLKKSCSELWDGNSYGKRRCFLKALAWQVSGWEIRYVRGSWARADRVVRLFQSGYFRRQTSAQHRTTPSSQKTAPAPFASCQK